MMDDQDTIARISTFVAAAIVLTFGVIAIFIGIVGGFTIAGWILG